MRVYVLVAIAGFFGGYLCQRILRFFSVGVAKKISERIWHVQKLEFNIRRGIIYLTLRSSDQDRLEYTILFPDTHGNRNLLLSLTPPFELVKFRFTREMMWYLPNTHISTYLLVEKASSSDSSARAHA